MYKMTIASCQNTVPEKKEPELEFYLFETDIVIYLRVRDKTNNVEYCGNIISILKQTGNITRCRSVNKEFGLPLDDVGRVVIV